jgi:hypothetical protein
LPQAQTFQSKKRLKTTIETIRLHPFGIEKNGVLFAKNNNLRIRIENVYKIRAINFITHIDFFSESFRARYFVLQCEKQTVFIVSIVENKTNRNR